jgi:prolyl oligopeptidase
MGSYLILRITMRSSPPFFAALTLAGIALQLPIAIRAQSAAPATPRREVADTYFGDVVVDPYRWMEAPTGKNPAFVKWLEAQNAHTRAILDRIPGRAALAERIRALDDTVVSAAGVDVQGGRWFYLKTEPGVEHRKLYVRDGPTGKERLLVDPQTLPAPEGSHLAVDYLYPSPNGRLLAYGLSAAGSEKTVLHILDVATGRVLPDSITRAQFPELSWELDGRAFFFNRLNAAGDTNPSERYRNSGAYRHVVGSPVDQDQQLLARGINATVTLGPDDFPTIVAPPGTPYVFAMVYHGVRPELSLYTTRRDALKGNKTQWRKVADIEDAVTNFAARGEDLFLLTHRDAPRFKIIRTKSAAPDLSRAETVVPPGRTVVQNLGAASDALYVEELEGGLARLRRIPYTGGSSEQIQLPFDGSIDFFVSNVRRPGVIFRLQSWTHSPLWYAYDPVAKKVRDTRLVPRAPIDYSTMESSEVEAPSADGTLIPLSIVHRRGLKLDGSHPTLLEAYGAYGFSFDPFFRPALIAWLERGGVYAVGHVRGGGEYGEEWHQAGKEATKPNTIADFIACAEYLVKKGYTSPAHLGGSGTSAGGITIGRALTERPDLFRAAIPRVGVMNALRAEVRPGGPANIPEFGTVKTEGGYRALLAMDAVHNVKPNTKYPAVLLTAGLHDSRVEPWEPGKMVAALQENSVSGHPVLFRVDFDAGHGMGLGKSQRSAELADIYAFLFWQLGSPEFQLSP